MKADEVYHNLLEKVRYHGVRKDDRTGVGTVSITGEMVKFDLREGFPLLTTKRVHTKSIIHENIWFLNGDTNIKYLIDNGVTIWTEWAYKRYRTWLDEHLMETSPDVYEYDEPENMKSILNADGSIFSQEEFENAIREDFALPRAFGRNATFAKIFGELGPVYGFQWRNFGRVSQTSMFGDVTTLIPGRDQVSNMLDQLRNNPDSRRILVSAWNPADVEYMALPPCHLLWQVTTEVMTLEERQKYWCDSLSKSIHYAEDFGHEELDEKGVPRRFLNLVWYQRSVDTFLGLPFNIAGYALLTHMIAQQVNMVPKELTGFLTDVHIYSNHFHQVSLQLSRNYYKYKSPKLKLNKAEDLYSYKFEDFVFENYEFYPGIKAPVAV